MTTTAQYGTAVYGDSYYGLLVLNCASGSYSITGGDANFIYDQVLHGNAGSYTLTGSDAGLDYDQILNCEAGSFTLTGNSATFIYDQTIYAGAFSFVWSGQQAGLNKTSVINAEAGSYTITGGTANLIATRLINGLAGHYVYTGKTAALSYNTNPVVVTQAKGGIDKNKRKYDAERKQREELEAIVKREFDILDGTYQPEVIIEARKAISAPLQQIDLTSYEIAIAQVNALLLQAKIQAAEYQSELDDEEALLMLL